MKKLKIKGNKINEIANNLSTLIMREIFLMDASYNGSLFSEYELIGNFKILIKPEKQNMIASLRKGLKGI